MTTTLEYLWVDNNQNPRSKVKIEKISPINPLPIWNFDGSSTGQADMSQTEVLLKPVRTFSHPFIENALLVLCECDDPTTGNPHISNSRHIALQKFKNSQDIWFGLEQEFFFTGTKEVDYQKPQGEYYCGNNNSPAIERKIMEEFTDIVIGMKIPLSGHNQEVAPSQWEYQIGPATAIDSPDFMVVCKFIMTRLCEKYEIGITFEPKYLSGDWNGSGCHINISTEKTRNDTELKETIKIIENIKKDHSNWLGKYDGKNNNLRLTGKHETSNPLEFTYGIGTRNTSVRIPTQVWKDGKGYFEDRRPGSLLDYYLSTSKYCDYL